MGQRLSEDLRIRVIRTIEDGLSRRAAAARFGVGVSSAIRWMSACLETGRTCAKPQGGDQRSDRIEAQADLLMGAIEAMPDITLEELRERLLTGRGEAFGISTIHDFHRRHGVTFEQVRGEKKRSGGSFHPRTAHASEQEREDVAERREAWFELQPDPDPAKLVFLDGKEDQKSIRWTDFPTTGATTKMARLRGRSPRGERRRASAPHGRWKTTTLVAGLRLDGLTAPFAMGLGPMAASMAH